MKRIFGIANVAALAVIVMIAGVNEASAQKRKPVLKRKTSVSKTSPVPPVHTVAAGTVIRARMNSTITSKSASVGSTFTSTLTEPVYATNGAVVIPTGSTLTGRVTNVTRASKGGKPGQIDVSFVSVRLPNGRVRSINGSLTELESGKTRSDDEGGVSGSKMKNRKVIFIGGGAAGGALLGAIAGGGKATAIGAILGAGAGFLGERYLKGPEAEVKSGTEFNVYLNQTIAMPKFVEVNP